MSTENEMVSIVVPMYNAERFLHECISSVLEQSYTDWELLLIDDGSIDKTAIICDEYVSKDTRIKYYGKANGGVSSARNLGIMNARGKYITFVDADDIIKKDYCERLISKMHSDIGMVVFGMEYLELDGRTAPLVHRFIDGIYSYDKFSKMVIDDGTMSGFSLHSSCAVLYHADIIKKHEIMFDEEIRYNEDGLFNVKYFLNSELAISIHYSECIYYYRTVTDSAVHQLDVESDIYINNIQLVEDKLYLLAQNFRYADIELQIVRRKMTILLERIIYLSKRKKLTVTKVRMMLLREKINRTVTSLNFCKMSLLKKLVCIAILLRLNVCITLIFRMRYSR